MGECFFWYRPTRVVPEKRLLNDRECLWVCVNLMYTVTITTLNHLIKAKHQQVDIFMSRPRLLIFTIPFPLWLGRRVVSVLDSGAEGSGSNRSRDAVG